MSLGPASGVGTWLGLLLALVCAAPAQAGLTVDLEAPHTVTVRDWLSVRLQVLGLELSYPAYRVALGLDESATDAAVAIRFEFWISTPMAEHLGDAGREETEQILTYHAQGIRRRVEELLRHDLPDLLVDDEEVDLEGEFLVPADELEAPPQRWARWRAGQLEWSWQP